MSIQTLSVEQLGELLDQSNIALTYIRLLLGSHQHKTHELRHEPRLSAVVDLLELYQTGLQTLKVRKEVIGR